MGAHLPLKISTANAYTGKDWVEMSLGNYLENAMGPQSPEKQGNDTFYLFGSTEGAEWDAFLAKYPSPTLQYPSESFFSRRLGSDVSGSAEFEQAGFSKCDGELLRAKQRDGVSLSFGIAGRGTGVPFHFHGPGFLQMLHGRKRWLLYPPKTVVPRFDPNETTLHWLSKRRRPGQEEEGAEEPALYECVLGPLDVVYFPDNWMHATLNIDHYTAFVASFA
eukprot:NODE_434_length_897_cov_64.542453_g379_i0.p1 GENE.NODE_434_length_897_cov_64.542453_g379_i0~~NODE_434_length_897_cov_64.542453_g379_i0.p1  ORF type:complete len:220 (-),score=23.47 NODE_434_length_897_cov_64.542453_g379_i0:205-864(-)